VVLALARGVQQRVHVGHDFVPQQRRVVLVEQRSADQRILVGVRARPERADRPRQLAGHQVQVAIRPWRVDEVRAVDVRRLQVFEDELGQHL
jgi:hypothetical protein